MSFRAVMCSLTILLLLGLCLPSASSAQQQGAQQEEIPKRDAQQLEEEQLPGRQPQTTQLQSNRQQGVLKGQVDRYGLGPDGRPRPGYDLGPDGHPRSGDGSRPEWVPPDAYSNPQMVMESYLRVRSGRIPVRVGPGNFTLEGSIARFWNSAQNYPACQVYMQPMWGRRGDFSFSTVGNPGGPKGWIQDIGNSAEGFPVYRFWYSHSTATHLY